MSTILLEKINKTIKDSDSSTREIIEQILNGVTLSNEKIDASSNSQRGMVWKALLGIKVVSSKRYITLVQKGASEAYGKIKNDTHRTLKTDEQFKLVVDEHMLLRTLNAFVWDMKDKNLSFTSDSTKCLFYYVQGMNALAAPFLFVMNEVDAFYSFSQLIQYSCPTYVQKNTEGVRCGALLLDSCLEHLDNELYNYLRSKSLSAEIYAFPCNSF
eukprot:NODE_237_length_13348_cov_0.297381.p5 type:complete len:214 gc:universal NODE_237_length_13348_cov_0.297381:13142-12501(-)